MAFGTLPNIANAGHEPTPDARAEQIAHNLLKLPRRHFTIIDGTCGEGNLLAPFQDNVHAELIGIEINGKWAELAAERLPQAQIITAAVEHVTIRPNNISLAVLNLPRPREQLIQFARSGVDGQDRGAEVPMLVQNDRFMGGLNGQVETNGAHTSSFPMTWVMTYGR